MAVKVYTPGQFYAAGGVVEEMFYQEVGRTKKYLRKRVGFVRSFEQVIKNLKDEAWRKFHYMKANVRGVDYTLVYDPLFILTTIIMTIYYHNAIYLFIFNLIVDSYQFNCR